jgi:hypothetical protein
MRISHKHKFIFIHSIKTGGTSIRNYLNDYSDIISVSDRRSPFYFHVSAIEMEKYFQEQGWDWNNYFKFAFVRNPWDRVVSFYHHILWNYETHPSLPYAKECLGGSNSFGTYLKSGILPIKESWQFNNISDFHIGRFENLQDDFNEICDKIGIPQQELPYTNVSNHKHYTEYYDDETREIVAKRYAEEIKMFDYEFGK